MLLPGQCNDGEGDAGGAAGEGAQGYCRPQAQSRQPTASATQPRPPAGSPGAAALLSTPPKDPDIGKYSENVGQLRTLTVVFLARMISSVLLS